MGSPFLMGRRTLAAAFSCIGLSGWRSFRRQLAELDAQYASLQQQQQHSGGYM